MPTYDYRCSKGHRFELFHGIHDKSVHKCPRCGSRAKRVPAGGAGLIFKGSGFYITDYRSKDYKEKAKQEKSEKSAGTKTSTGDTGTSGGSKKGPEKS